MRIAFLPSSYLPESLGGTEIYVHHLAEALQELGHRVAVVYHPDCHVQTQEELPYEVFRLPPCQPRRRADLYLHTRGEDPPEFNRFVQQWQPDLVHFHAFTLGAGLDHSRALRRHRIPYYVTYHTPTFSCARGTLMRWGREVCDGAIEPTRCSTCVFESQGWPFPLAYLLARSPAHHDNLPDGPWTPRVALPALLKAGRSAWQEFMGRAEHIIACANWCKDVLVRNGIRPTKVTTIRQALPGASRVRELRLPIAKHSPTRIGFFGRFAWIKGPDLLLKAASSLRKQGVPIRCELVGPIADKERRWANLLLQTHQDHAIYEGIKRGEALRTWLRGLDLVVLPSRWLETGPLTLLEAWDEETPAVGSDLGGIQDFFRAAHLESLLFEPNDADDLARVILRAINWKPEHRPAVAINGMTEMSQATLAIYKQQELVPLA